MSDSWFNYLLHDLPMSFLSGATSGLADEGIAAITGLTTGRGYDAELKDIRQGIKDFRETNTASSLGGEIAGGLGQAAALAPLFAASTVAKVPSVIGAGISAAKSGALQGLAQGFFEGEGGIGNRIDRAGDSALGSAVLAGLLGTTGRVVFGRGGVEKAGDDLMRSSFGFTANDYKTAMRGPGEQVLRKEGKSALSNVVGRLRGNGVLTNEILKDPENYSLKLDSKISELGKQLKGILDEVDDSGVAVGLSSATFDRTLQGINENMSGKAKEQALSIFKKETESLLKDKPSGLSGINKMKQNIQGDVSSAYSRANPSMGDEIKMSLASDIKRHIESEVNAAAQNGFVPNSLDGQVKNLNQQMSDIFAIKPTVEKRIAQGNTSNLFNNLISGIKTTGGAGVPLLAGAYTGNPLLGLLGGGMLSMAISPMSRYRVGAGMVDAAQQLDPAILSGRLGETFSSRNTDVGLNPEDEENSVALGILQALTGR